MSKPMTFEEWATATVPDDWARKSLSQKLEAAWNDARIGMISEGEAVRIPPVGDWPEGAVGIRVLYSYQSVDFAFANTDIRFIPRPVPAWTPKVGDAAFAKFGTVAPVICRVEQSGAGGNWNLTRADGTLVVVDIEEMKPFAPEHIGKPWEEIPNGN